MGKNKSVKSKDNSMKFKIIGLAIVGVLGIGYFYLSRSSADKTTDVVSSDTSKESSNAETNGNNASNADTKTESASTTTPGIEINKEEITSTAKFYQYDSKGIKMEVLALKASDGTIRVAFNTCQVCYSSGKGYYVQDGDELVCQNCGNRFTSDMVGKTKGGCNPVPITDASKTDDGTKITIDKNYLDKNKAYFSNWKA